MSQVLQVNGDYLVKVQDNGRITLDTGSIVGEVYVTGNLVVDNDLTVGGNLILGNASQDEIQINGKIISDLIPFPAGVHNLGSDEYHWGAVYTSQVLPQLGGNLTIKGLVDPVEGRDAATKDYVDTVLGRVDNVYYVAMSGNDDNDGRSLAKAKRTIKAAVEEARNSPTKGYDTTIFIKSGDYTEDNPIRIPAKLALWGDSLRTTTVRPRNKTQDLFWVTNGSYITNLTLKDHEAPAAAVAFPPPTEEYPAVSIYQSPYVWNCTSITTTGCGMRVDGAYTTGLKSMVLDSYTQYNQGGIGIHMLNRGNTQLVSAFTINCDIAILCTAGGFCSLTNSNASFGNYGLVSDGVSEALYSGTLRGSSLGIIGDTISLNNLVERPNVGDAVSFGGSTSYYTVTIAEPLTAGGVSIQGPDVSGQPSDKRAVRQIGLASKEKIQIDTIDFVNETYKGLSYNQFKCTRDTGLIVDAVLDDMALGTNYKSVQAGLSYSRVSAAEVRDKQKNASIAALDYTRSQLLDAISGDSTTGNPEYVTVDSNFNIIRSLFSAASATNPPTPPEYVFTPPVGAEQGTVNARDIIIANREFLIQEGIAYIEQNLTFNYNRETCQRDVGLVIDAIGYDLMFGSNFRSITAGRSYWRAQASTVVGVQKTATIDAFNYLKGVLQNLVITDAAAYESVTTNMDLIIDIIDQGLTAVPPSYTIPNPTSYDVGYQRARDLIEANRAFIKEEVLAYIGNAYPTFVYDQATCQRDVDLILDAIYYDVTYGGNLETLIAGRAYFSAGTIVNPGEETQTLAAYAFMKTLIMNIAKNIDVIELQVDVPQVFGTAGSTAAANFVGTLVEDIRTIIAQGPAPEVRSPDLRWVVPAYVVFHETFQEERDDTARLVTNYIDSRYFLLDYDRATCQRDIGLIIDAIAYDLMFGSNFKTITAGRAYIRGTASVVNSAQKPATIDAFNKLKTLLVALVTDAETTQYADTVSSLMDIILSILDKGASAVPAFVIPNPVGYDVEYQRARTLINANRNFILAEVSAYIDQTYPTLVYDEVACQRDVGYILDAIYYDMTYGGNQETLIAGRAYYSFGVIVNPGEEDETLGTYNYLKSLVLNIAQSISVTALQVTVPQALGTGSNAVAATAASNLVENIRTIISGSTPTSTLPSTAWVEAVVVAKATVLLNNKASVQDQVTDFIDATYNTNKTPFVYDAEKCKRDVGLIVDALSWDLAFNSNFRSITAGRSYWRGNASIVSDRQKQATIEAYQVLRTFVAGLVSEDVAASQSVTSNMDMIVDIFDQGLSAVPAYQIPAPTGYSTELKKARDLVEQNREFIVAEVVRYISDQQQSSLNYDKDKCQRDVGLIIDAVGYDMMFGSNFRSITAGRAYYRANASVVTGVQKAATIDAFGYLKTLLTVAVDGNIGARTSVSDNMDIIIDILTNGLTAVPTYVLPAPTGYDVGFQHARDLVEANREFIKAEVTKYIEINYNSVYLTFDQAACERDIGYILDAVRYDMTYGGNLESLVAANAYYVGSVLQLGTGEKTATLAAYNYMKTIVGLIAQNQDVTQLQNVVTQVTGTAGSSAAATAAQALVEVIRDVITDNVAPATVTPSTTWVAAALTDRYTILQNSKETIQVKVTDYVDNYYPFTYDRDLCQRDVGLIIDAVGYDMMFNSNFRSITAGRAYYRSGASVVSTIQKAATLDAFTYLKDLMINTVSANATAVSRITTSMDLVLNIITNGLSAIPGYSIPAPTGYDVNYQRARDLIESNRNFIKAEVDKYIEINYNSVYLTFDKVACQRDIGYILDAVYYDMTYGCNMETLVAGYAYYSNAVLQLGAGEKAATLAAYTFMRDLIIAVAQSQDVIELQSAVPQVTGTPGSAAAANAAGTLINNIVDIITDNVGPVQTTPSTTWVSSSLVAQFTALQSSKNLIKGQVTTYIDNEYVEPSYNRVKCERDIGYILDAVYYDMTYGGNMETAIAANSYFVGTNIMIPGEVEATLDAYAYMRDIVYSIAQSIAITPRQTDVQQVLGQGSGTAAAQVAADRIQDIRTVIDTGVLITAPTLASTAWVSAGTMDQFNILQQERENAKIAVADYVDSTYFLLTYNRDKCKRDIGYMIDAIGYDVMFASNFRSISAARSYYRMTASRVVEAQKSATIGALRRMKELALITAAGNLVAEQRIKDSVELMVDIINRGPAAIPAYVVPNPSGFSSTYSNARALVEANRAFLKAEVIEYIRQTYVVPNGFTYDQATCERDMEFILDAVYYDITYGTNAETLVAARAYYVGNNLVNASEKTQTVAAFNYLQVIISQVAQNIDVVQLQTTVLQVFGAPGSINAANDISNLIGNVISYINTPSIPPALIAPNTSWVNPNYVATYNNLQSSKEAIKAQVQVYIDTKYAYNQTTCARDIGYMLDATIYDILYGGNSQTIAAAETYYSAGVFQIGARERLMSINTFKYLKSVLGACLLNIEVTPINTVETQNLLLPPATYKEVITSNQLFTNIAEIIENGFTSVITLNENIPDFDPQYPGTKVTFHQYSLITASGQTFEWVGAGTNVNTSLPYLGGIPISENKAVETNGGKVYWTGTDQFGDFNIGGELVIRRDSGTIEGRTFTKSLFAVLTPYILAVGE